MKVNPTKADVLPTHQPYCQYTDRVWDSACPIRKEKILDNTTCAVITLSSGGRVRFTVDGSTVTNKRGHLLNEGETLFLDSIDDVINFKAVQATDTVRGVITVSLYAPEEE